MGDAGEAQGRPGAGEHGSKSRPGWDPGWDRWVRPASMVFLLGFWTGAIFLLVQLLG